MTKEVAELTKVGATGFVGFIASLKLADVATLTSIGVGVATIIYIGAKTYFLFKNRGNSPTE